jgi:alanine-glyoxylate transaminase/serine-glyoxylate transaminase/serine-pyruvate transaminase
MQQPTSGIPKRILMGPGPSNVHPRVLEAMARPTIGHLDPAFIDVMEEIKSLLRYVFRTENEVTFPVSGPGSAGMEMALVNVVEPGDKVIVCRNGVFGGRMLDIVERCGGKPVLVDEEWGRPVDPGKLEDTLKAHSDAAVVAFVHAETSTGALSDAQTLAGIAHRYGCLVVADTVTSLGGVPVHIDDWGIDVSYSGSQKCLSCPPGLSPITFNERAVEKIRHRKTRVQSWFLDLNLVISYWGKAARRTYHHTAPVNAMFGLREALLLIKEEGLENAWRRHRVNHLALCAGLEAMGLQLAVAPEHRIPSLNPVRIPEGVDDSRVRSRLLEEFNLEIGAGLGAMAGKIWRIGLMGYSSSRENVLYCLEALETVLAAEGAPVRKGEARKAAESIWNRDQG